MFYYGLILFNLRRIKKPKKITDVGMTSNENEEMLTNAIIKLDRLILFMYGIIFAAFNAYYFMKYYLK